MGSAVCCPNDANMLQMLPLRPTKSFLSYSVEKLEKSSQPFQASYRLWNNEAFQAILPDLLQFLRCVFLQPGHSVHTQLTLQPCPCFAQPRQLARISQ